MHTQRNKEHASTYHIMSYTLVWTFDLPMQFFTQVVPRKCPSAATRESRAPGHKRQLWFNKSSDEKNSGHAGNTPGCKVILQLPTVDSQFQPRSLRDLCKALWQALLHKNEALQVRCLAHAPPQNLYIVSSKWLKFNNGYTKYQKKKNQTSQTL